MSMSLKKLWNDYGIGAIIVLLIVAYGINTFAGYLGNKGLSGKEYNSEMQTQYVNSNNGNMGGVQSGMIQASDPNGNSGFASVDGIQSSSSGVPVQSTGSNMFNPAELLPKKDKENEWQELNPSGQGDLANLNLLKAGYHIGIDTVGQSLRNANLQIRSEPPNPQMNVGPWNTSTITPDYMRPALEIGSGGQ